MPRQIGVQYAGAICHVMSRGDHRENVFLDDVNRQDFLKTLAETCQKTGFQVHAYCMMPLKWIARRVELGTSKSANGKLHAWMKVQAQQSEDSVMVSAEKKKAHA